MVLKLQIQFSMVMFCIFAYSPGVIRTDIQKKGGMSDSQYEQVRTTCIRSFNPIALRTAKTL